MSRTLGAVGVILVGLLSVAPVARADEIKVATSGAFTAAFLELAPVFERATHNTVATVYGASMGSTGDVAA